MISFTVTIQQFAEQGEKTGWTYIGISAAQAGLLQPGNKKSFRVKGTIDAYAISGVALLPMGDGSFIIPLNAAMRRGIKKPIGATVVLRAEPDKQALTVPPELLDCLADEPAALEFFSRELLLSHRNYYIKWLGGVQGDAAKARRLAQAVEALVRRYDFRQFMGWLKAQRDK